MNIKFKAVIGVFGAVLALQVSSAEAQTFSQDLYFGLRNNPEVTRLQEFLTSQRLYSGPITGNFFVLTQAAVREFQKKHNIAPAAGYWGPKTRGKANTMQAASSVPNAVLPNVPRTTFVDSPKFTPGTSTQSQISINAYWTLTATTTDARWPSVPEPASREINPRALVALYCHGRNGNTWEGSGNIIHPKGYILTNRHVAADTEYCEVGMPDAAAKLPTRGELVDLNRNLPLNIPGWRPYKAVNYFIPGQDGLSDDEKFALDFAIMKISSINDNCQVFSSCDPLPTSFPYNITSNFHMTTSTAGQDFPVNIVTTRFHIPLMPHEMIMYGYPAIGAGGGGSHVLRGNLGYAMAYFPGDKRFPGYPITMLTRVLYGTYGGASGSGVFYRGHIIGLTYAAFSDISVAQSVIPMPFISMILSENGKGWILDPSISGE